MQSQEGFDGGRREAQERGDTCIQIAFTSLYGRNQHKIVKQLYFKNNK